MEDSYLFWISVRCVLDLSRSTTGDRQFLWWIPCSTHLSQTAVYFSFCKDVLFHPFEDGFCGVWSGACPGFGFFCG